MLLQNYGKYTRPEYLKRPGAEAGARRRAVRDVLEPGRDQEQGPGDVHCTDCTAEIVK